MTAVVGIINKKAVAIAADSAVTLHNGKIFNKANKIFTLSKYHPVGIMIHNIDSLMGTPWEIIIKLYRSKLKDSAFDTLAEYQEDFIKFVLLKDFFCDENNQRLNLNLFTKGIADYLVNESYQTIQDKKLDRDRDFINVFKEAVKNRIAFFSEIKEKMPHFENYTFDDFVKFIEPDFQNVLDYSFSNEGIVIDEEIKDLLKEAYYHQLVAQEFSTMGYTGLIFTGYGDKEIFPSLIPLQVYIGFDKKLRYFVNYGKGAKITHEDRSAICTFAQSDVMLTILTGVAPELKEIYNLSFKNLLNDYDQSLINNYTGDKGELKLLIDKMDKNDIEKVVMNLMDEVIQKKYISPLFQAVASLSKEDLAEMAESLIYLTYLQRRITNAEESVGGPVDVAVLSKGDGFIWIKRKHYFKPELNNNFLSNYFK